MAEAADELKDLLVKYGGSDALDLRWLEVCVGLLKFCHDHPLLPSAWSEAANEPLATIENAQVSIVARLARECDVGSGGQPLASNFAPVHALDALSELVSELLTDAANLDTCPAPATLAVGVAYGAALAIDDLFGAAFIDWFRGRGLHQLQEGEPYPVVPRDPRRWLGDRPANSSPSSLPSRDLTCTPHLRLGTELAAKFDFVLDFDSWNRLAPLGDDRNSLVIAVGQPNLDLSDFNISISEGQPGSFRNRGPIRPRHQAGLLLAQIEAAAEHRADVFLLPEYSLNLDTRDELMHQLRDLPHKPRLIVAGLCEPTESGGLHNRSWLAMHGSHPVLTHEVTGPPKLFAADFHQRREEIQTGSEVRIWMTERWTVAVLICRDALNDDVLAQLADIGVNLVLVPAMTEKTATMIQLVSMLQATTQAFVVLANGPARIVQEMDSTTKRGVRVEGYFGGPYGQEPSHVRLPEPASIPANDERGLWTFDTASMEVRWIPTPLKSDTLDPL